MLSKWGGNERSEFLDGGGVGGAWPPTAGAAGKFFADSLENSIFISENLRKCAAGEKKLKYDQEIIDLAPQASSDQRIWPGSARPVSHLSHPPTPTIPPLVASPE